MSKVNINGVWKDLDKVFVNIGGVWKEAEKMFCNIGGVWKEVEGINSVRMFAVNYPSSKLAELNPDTLAIINSADSSIPNTIALERSLGNANGVLLAGGRYENSGQVTRINKDTFATISYFRRYVSYKVHPIATPISNDKYIYFTLTEYNDYDGSGEYVDYYPRHEKLNKATYATIETLRISPPHSGNGEEPVLGSTGNDLLRIYHTYALGDEYDSIEVLNVETMTSISKINIPRFGTNLSVVRRLSVDGINNTIYVSVGSATFTNGRLSIINRDTFTVANTVTLPYFIPSLTILKE